MPVIACTFTTATVGGLAAVLLRQQGFAVLAWCGLGLGLVSLAAAIGIAVKLPVLRWHAEPAAPSRMVMVAGVVAAALMLGLDLVDRIGPEPDRTALGLAGVAVVVVGVVLAARLGRRVLGAVLAITLISSGHAIYTRCTVLELVIFLVGAALGGLAATTGGTTLSPARPAGWSRSGSWPGC